MKRPLVFACLSLAFAFSTGCGPDLPDTVPVTGTVTLDGKPVEGATVNFLSEESNVTASGKTDASGNFSLKSYIGAEALDGAVVGTHGISVVKTETEQTETKDPKEMMAEMANSAMVTSDFKERHLVPQKYGNPTMSQLTAQVSAEGPNDVKLDLKSK